ncbi:MAG: hypothetical protein ACR2H5_12950 [Ktedonobacteraceae bacterium]
MTAKIEGDEPILATELANHSFPGHLRCPKTVEEQEGLPLTTLAHGEFHLSV